LELLILGATLSTEHPHLTHFVKSK